MSETMDFMQMLSSCLRTYVIGLPGQWIGLVIGCAMMERRRKLTPLIWYLAIKTLFFLLLDGWVNYYFAGQEWVNLPLTISSSWGAILTCFMFHWTFKGGVVKVVTGMNISEVLATLLMLPSAIVVNALEGRETLTDITGQFHILDLLVGVLMFVLLAVVYPFTASFLKKYRNFEFKYKKLMWVLIGGYFIITQSIPFFGMRDDKMFGLTMYLLHLASAVIIIMGMYGIYYRNQRNVRRENEFLRMQMHLMEGHYIATQKQIRNMENSRQLVEHQMRELTDTADSRRIKQRKITSYLEALQSEYDQIQAGMYCDDWMVDAVLYCQIETARRQGIEVDCSLQGYDRGGIKEDDLIQILYQLLEYGIRECGKSVETISENQICEAKKLRLHIGTIKNQMIISFSGNSAKKKFSAKTVKVQLVKYKGTMKQEYTEDKFLILITLENNQQ